MLPSTASFDLAVICSMAALPLVIAASALVLSWATPALRVSAIFSGLVSNAAAMRLSFDLRVDGVVVDARTGRARGASTLGAGAAVLMGTLRSTGVAGLATTGLVATGLATTGWATTGLGAAGVVAAGFAATDFAATGFSAWAAGLAATGSGAGLATAAAATGLSATGALGALVTMSATAACGATGAAVSGLAATTGLAARGVRAFFGAVVGLVGMRNSTFLLQRNITGVEADFKGSCCGAA